MKSSRVLDRPANVRLYLGAVGASVLGDTAMSLVAGIWTKQLTDDDSLAALVTVFVWLPTLAAPWLGTLVDRVPPIRLLITTQLTMAATLGPLLLVDEAREIALLFAVMTAYGVSYVLVGAAEAVLVPRLVDETRLARINGIRASMQESGAKIVAPALGAGAFVALGPHTVVVLDMLSFALSSILLALIRLPSQPDPGTDEARRAPGGARAGLRAIPTVHGLPAAVLAVALGRFAFGTNGAFVYRMIEEALHRPPEFLGVLAVAQGVGSVTAGLVAGRLIGRIGESVALTTGLAVTAPAPGCWRPAPPARPGRGIRRRLRHAHRAGRPDHPRPTTHPRRTARTRLRHRHRRDIPPATARGAGRSRRGPPHRLACRLPGLGHAAGCRRGRSRPHHAEGAEPMSRPAEVPAEVGYERTETA